MDGCGITDILGLVVCCFTKHIFPYITTANEVEDKYGENGKLKDKLQTLKDKARRMQEKVYTDEEKRNEAAKWMLQAAQHQDQATKLMDSYQEMLDQCLPGTLPPWVNIFRRHETSKSADSWLDKASRLLEDADTFSIQNLEDRIRKVPMAQNPVGIDSEVEKLKNFVKDPSTMIMGICGMPGVGKATLVRKLNNDLYSDFKKHVDRERLRLSEQDFSEAPGAEENGRLLLSPTEHFDVVIFSGEEETTSEDAIRQGIAKRLGLAWRSKEATSVADDISKALRSLKFLIIMVDLWDGLNLQKLGIPNNGHPGSKVIFTTQTEKVLTNICNAFCRAKNPPMHLRCLKWQPAWKFFMGKLDCSLGTNERDAKEIVKMCGGLPIALEAIASRMESRKDDVQEWSKTLRFLEAKPEQIDELDHTINGKLGPYYYRLEMDEVQKKCFIYCALFPGKRGIKKDWLVQYWRAEGFKGIIRYSDSDLRDLITYLTEASLLERVCPEVDDDDDDGDDGCGERSGHVDDETYRIGGAGGDDDEDYVKMHSMYRILALWLKKDELVVQTRGTQFGHWKKAVRMCLMMNDLKSMRGMIARCKKLRTLVVNGNTLRDIPPEILENKSCLKVLDLSSTAIEELPSEIFEGLHQLSCLNLYKSKLKKLPEGLKHLKKLRFLNLGYTTALEIIPDNVISSLESLIVLIMYASYGAWDVDSSGGGVKFGELENLTHLEELAITVEKEKVLKKLCDTQRLAGITSQLLIRGCQGMHSFQLPQLPIMSRLRLVRVVDCPDLGVLEIGSPGENWTGSGGTQEWKLELKDLPKSRIQWTARIQSLAWLSITNCNGIKGQLIGNSTEKNDEQKEKIEILGALRYLELNDLPGLDGIYDCLLPFDSLRTFKVLRCPKLKRLPFGPDGAKKLGRIYCEKGWWDELQVQGGSLHTGLINLVKFEESHVMGE